MIPRQQVLGSYSKKLTWKLTPSIKTVLKTTTIYSFNKNALIAFLSTVYHVAARWVISDETNNDVKNTYTIDDNRNNNGDNNNSYLLKLLNIGKAISNEIIKVPYAKKSTWRLPT